MCNKPLTLINRHVFDLDNTLISTNVLNNDSYNYALIKFGLPPINNCVRITRNTVFKCFPRLNAEQKAAVIELKQKYFFDNIKNTRPNTVVFNILNAQSAEHCVLWTSAEKDRVQALLNYYNIVNRFKGVLYSEKNNVTRDIDIICNLLKCEPFSLIFYEDNQNIVEEILRVKINVVSI